MKIKLMLCGLLATIAASRVEAACSYNLLAQVPVTMNGLRPIASAKINGEDAPFLIDTGAFFGVIGPASAAQFKLPVQAAPEGFYVGGVGGQSHPSIAVVKNFTLAGIMVPNFDFMVAGADIGRAGVIGQNLLHAFDLELDLAQGRMNLFRPSGCGQQPLAYWAANQPLSILEMESVTAIENHNAARITVNGTRLIALFDTGASLTTISRDAAARAGIRPDSPGVTQLGKDYGFLGRDVVKEWRVPVKQMKIGGEELKNVTIRMIEMPNIDILIGADFFLSHRVFISNNQNKMYFTYNGGPVFLAGENASLRAVDGSGNAVAAATGPEPTDAAGFATRGAAAAIRGDLSGALGDYDHAVTLAPDNAAYRLARANLYLQLRKPAEAEADASKAIALKADDAQAFVLRGLIRGNRGAKDLAVADFDEAARIMSPNDNRRLDLALRYSRIDRRDKAIIEEGKWIDAHPQDNRRYEAMNDRCFDRGMANVELEKALADCNAAVRCIPDKELALDSRGLVYLRMGNWAAAIADYSAALKLSPKLEWSLFGRGIAELRVGEKAAAEKDFAAAEAVNSKIREQAKARDLIP